MFLSGLRGQKESWRLVLRFWLSPWAFVLRVVSWSWHCGRAPWGGQQPQKESHRLPSASMLCLLPSTWGLTSGLTWDPFFSTLFALHLGLGTYLSLISC